MASSVAATLQANSRMRNFNVITDGIDDESQNDVKCIYKEVVVVGNGPSGITLSYLLNGYRPYYNKIPHPDPMLSARLIECTHKSLLHQDLSFLSQGIEGRSKNPISLLVDAMTHPGADMGLEWPSLLTWKKTAKSLDHIVLGKGDPGGTWPAVADQVLTISPGRWMALPGLEFKDYNDKRAPAVAVAQYYMDYVKKHDLTQYMAPQSTVTMIQPLVSKFKKRARWKVWVTDANGVVSYECRHLVLATGSSDKAGCLEVPGESLSYVSHKLRQFEELLANKKGHDPYISSSVDNAEKPPYSRKQNQVPKTKSNGHLPSNASDVSPYLGKPRRGLIEMVEGDTNGWREENSGTRTTQTSNPALKDLKMATISDIERDDYAYEYLNGQRSAKSSGSDFGEKDVWIGENIPVEDINVSLDVLDLSSQKDLGHEGKQANGEDGDEEEGDKGKNGRVLIVGAGLSAADAILAAWRKNFSVVHAFRNPLTTTKLPAMMYPEYHELYRLMQGLDSRKDYLPLPGHQVTEFFKDNTVGLVDSTGAVKKLRVSSVAILIGSQPDLFFLPKALKNLGIDPGKPVDCKLNPIQIDPYSYKCVRAPAGLYALGPLVGDNFVRFLQGGAVAIAGHILKDNNFNKNVK